MIFKLNPIISSNNFLLCLLPTFLPTGANFISLFLFPTKYNYVLARDIPNEWLPILEYWDHYLWHLIFSRIATSTQFTNKMWPNTVRWCVVLHLFSYHIQKISLYIIDWLINWMTISKININLAKWVAQNLLANWRVTFRHQHENSICARATFMNYPHDDLH